jgi:hypothetical protein
MSLVGSLEDLGLGEILQIVSLSGKSGVLRIRARHGEGCILLARGLIRGAFLKEGPADLCELVRTAGLLPDAQLERLHAEAQAEGIPLEALLCARTPLDAARIDALRERHVESTVLRMLGWRSGEFSFEMSDRPTEGADEELLLRSGLNGQFLAFESARLRDEDTHREGGSGPRAGAADDGLAFSGDEEPGADPRAPEGGVPDELPLGVLELVEDQVAEADLPLLLVEELDADGETVIDDEPTQGGVARPPAPAAAAAAAPGTAPDAAARAPEAPAVIAVDRELALLEWIKGALSGVTPRVHIFQRSEQAIARIRQYVARGELPTVLLTSATPPDPVSGARDWEEIAARLRQQIPNVPIALLVEPGAAPPSGGGRTAPDATAPRPDLTVLSDERAHARRESLAEALRVALGRARGRGAPRAAGERARASQGPRPGGR